MTAAAARIVAGLKLAPLPHEGGFFRRQWVSAAVDAAGRPAAGRIWFLVTAEGFSALHRVDAEERWEFHAGEAIEHVQLTPGTATPRVTVLGHATAVAGAARAQQHRLLVPAGAWQGARLAPTPAAAGATAAADAACGWALLSCTMTPAWVEAGFALGERSALRREFPGAADWIHALTR